MQSTLKIRLAVILACGTMTAGAFAQSVSQSTPANAPMTPTPPGSVPAAPAVAKSEAPVPAANRPLLMQGLDNIGAGKFLDDAGITISGFAEASYTYSASSPPNNFISGRVFDVDHEDITLNQLDLSIDRPVDAKAAAANDKLDVGFHVEGIYGGDSRFIHASGLNFYGPDGFQNSPDEQVDLVQAYVDFGIPVGNGLRIRAGKFVTLLGQETINPTTNALYSHSYLFGYAIPFTHTGVLGTYAVNDKLTIDAGFTRGWNQALKDNNGDAFDFLGRVTYAFDDKLTGYLSATVGPEAAGDPGNWWYVVDAIATYKVDDKLSFAVNADYGFYTHGSAGGSSAQWYGIAGYSSYVISDMFHRQRPRRGLRRQRRLHAHRRAERRLRGHARRRHPPAAQQRPRQEPRHPPPRFATTTRTRRSSTPAPTTASSPPPST